MFPFLKRRGVEPDRPLPSVGEDRRVYAIGDIHGRIDLFERLLARVAADDAAREPLPTHIILLGDLVDRGPHSAQVVERAMTLATTAPRTRLVMGNHEEVFLHAARGAPRAARFFLRIGGAETLRSYGLPDPDRYLGEEAALADWMLNHIPRAHVDFLARFEDYVEMGDYLFVHAGIRPDRPIGQQESSDLRWIRHDFLRHAGWHGHMVVHGHTITDDVDEQPNRIGIDTGAFYSGRLTAIGLEGTRRWFVDTAH